jgi:cytochrome bd-type quinol oxidase subunit 2
MMRSTDEQLRLVRNRASKLRMRRRRMLRRGAAAGCLLPAAVLGFLLPSVEGSAAIGAGAVYGSVILTSPALSYIVVAILAFILGACVTLLCLHRRGRTGSPEEEEQ